MSQVCFKCRTPATYIARFYSGPHKIDAYLCKVHYEELRRSSELINAYPLRLNDRKGETHADEVRPQP